MKDMSVEAKIPLGVTIKGVKLGKRGRGPSVAPCKPPVLKMDLLELTSLKSRAEAVDTATVDVAVVLILGPPNLIEIA